MMDSLKNKIVKLENNKEYFVLETLIDNNINYMLLLNLVDDKEIKIVKMILDNGEEYFVEITDDKELTSLKSRFKDILDEQKKKIISKIVDDKVPKRKLIILIFFFLNLVYNKI